MRAPDPAKMKSVVTLPIHLRLVALLYGMQLTSTCRRRKVNHGQNVCIPLATAHRKLVTAFGHPLAQKLAWPMHVDSSSHLPAAKSSRASRPCRTANFAFSGRNNTIFSLLSFYPAPFFHQLAKS
jgi:hypothetical protein